MAGRSRLSAAALENDRSVQAIIRFNSFKKPEPVLNFVFEA